MIIYYLDILFKLALQESYAAATNYLNVQPHTATDTVRMLIKHDDLISHNHMWSSSTHVIGNDEALHRLMDDWQNAMQSGEEVDLSTGSIEFIFQYALTRAHVPAAARVGARQKGKIFASDAYTARKEKMYNRISINDIFEKDKTLLNVPHTIEKVCFPMAFLSSQCRYLENDVNGNIVNVVESSGEPKVQYLKTKQTNLFIPCPTELLHLQQHLPYFVYGNQICLFNCYRIYVFNYANIFIIMLK